MSSLSAMIKNPVDAWIGSHFIELTNFHSNFYLYFSVVYFWKSIFHGDLALLQPLDSRITLSQSPSGPPIDNNRETNRSQATTQPLPPPITKTLSSPAHDQGRPNPHGHKISQKSS